MQLQLMKMTTIMKLLKKEKKLIRLDEIDSESEGETSKKKKLE